MRERGRMFMQYFVGYKTCFCTAFGILCKSQRRLRVYNLGIHQPNPKLFNMKLVGRAL